MRDDQAMRSRLVAVLVPLLVALVAALGVPLAAFIAQRETQAVYLDRLADADRFASLTDDALRRGRIAALTAEIAHYDEVYGIAVAIYAPDGRLLVASRPFFDADLPAVRNGLSAAFAGRRSEDIAAVWPWRAVPMVVVEPVGRDTGVIAAVAIVSPTDQLRAGVLGRWGELAALGFLPFLVLVAATVQLARWVLRPVRDLDQATVAIAAGRLDARALTVVGPPELRRLASSFNTMIDTVVRTMRRQRSFAADASHQLRNPLASLRLAVDNLSSYVQPAGRDLHEIAVAEVEEMEHVVEDMLALTAVGGTPLTRTAQPVVPTVVEHARRWRQVAADAGMTVTVEIANGVADAGTYAPADALGSLLDELVGNACRLSGGTSVVVAVARADSDLVLSVRDNGIGLSDDELAKAGSREWRAANQADTPGTGLGLAICAELVDAWGGRLELQAAEPRGLQVVLSLPAADVS